MPRGRSVSVYLAVSSQLAVESLLLFSTYWCRRIGRLQPATCPPCWVKHAADTDPVVSRCCYDGSSGSYAAWYPTISTRKPAENKGKGYVIEQIQPYQLCWLLMVVVPGCAADVHACAHPMVLLIMCCWVRLKQLSRQPESVRPGTHGCRSQRVTGALSLTDSTDLTKIESYTSVAPRLPC